MSRFSELIDEIWRGVTGGGEPWYRRRELWIAVVAVVVPFGWVVPLYQLARVRAARVQTAKILTRDRRIRRF